VIEIPPPRNRLFLIHLPFFLQHNSKIHDHKEGRQYLEKNVNYFEKKHIIELEFSSKQIATHYHNAARNYL